MTSTLARPDRATNVCDGCIVRRRRRHGTDTSLPAVLERRPELLDLGRGGLVLAELTALQVASV